MTTFTDSLPAGHLALALEITPPQSLLPGVLTRRAGLLGGAATAINVIQRPGRLSSLDACVELRSHGYRPVWHLVIRGRSREDIRADLVRANDAGIDQLLCILGDHAAAPSPSALTVREAVAMARELMPGALIGATFNQYAPEREKALRNLVGKCDAGATYVQTQPAFDAVSFADTARQLRTRLPGVAVVPMVMPLLSLDSLGRIESRLNITIPAPLRARIALGEDQAWDAFRDTVAGLATSGEVQGFAVMTFQMDPPPGTGERLLAALHAAGVPIAV